MGGQPPSHHPGARDCQSNQLGSCPLPPLITPTTRTPFSINLNENHSPPSALPFPVGGGVLAGAEN